MHAVYKYEISDATDLDLPEGAKVLHVGVQNHKFYLWADVDPAAVKTKRYFYLFPTGVPFNDFGFRHVGSFQEGAFVWHVFERVTVHL